MHRSRLPFLLRLCGLLGGLLLCLALPAQARTGLVGAIERELAAHQSETVPAQGEMEVAFSPGQGATALILRAIASARTSVRVAAYEFTSRPIIGALIDAAKRGVDVQVVTDAGQQDKRYSGINTTANSGIPTRVNDKYRILHDKFIVIDEQTVVTGSFNFSHAAETANSENVLVNWRNPRLAAIYGKHWQRLWDEGKDVRPRY